MKTVWKIARIVLLAALGLFLGTFAIYMLNLENKLIYKFIYPFLQKHFAQGVMVGAVKA